MVRDFEINGPTMVKVKGGAHLSGYMSTPTELGLCLDQIRITPVYYHKDINVDDFGPNCPANVMTQLAEVNVRMSLSHYDRFVLDYCLAESMGGNRAGALGVPQGGTLVGAGTQLGNGYPVFSSGNHFISLNLLSEDLGYPWRFPTSYLAGQPYEYPIGTNNSIVVVNWRCIPYVPVLTSQRVLSASGSSSTTVYQEPVSSGVVLFDHTLDT